MKKAIITDVITYFHLASALSFCLKMGVSSVLVLVRPGMDGVLHLRPGVYSISGLRVRIQAQRDINAGNVCDAFLALCKRLVSLVKKGSGDMLIGHHTYFKPGSITAKYSGNATTFSFEEGLGTYGNLAHHLKVSKRERLSFPRTKFYLKKLLNTPIFADESWRPLYVESVEDLSLLRKVFHSLPNAFDLTLSVNKNAGDGYKKRTMLFFTAPLVELGLIDRDEYHSVLSQIERSLLAKGVEVVFKPHPLEEWLDSKFTYLDAKVPSEVVVSAFEPDYVGGFSTGALITSRLIFGITAISFNSFLPERLRTEVALEGDIAELFNRHVEIYSEAMDLS